MFLPDQQYGQQRLENQYWIQLAQSYLHKIQELEQKVDNLNLQQHMVHQKLRAGNGITIQNLKVNNIQSGAAFNIAEKLYSTTKSDMDMDLGPNSMNVGDHNQMEHQGHDDCTVKLSPTKM